MSQTFLLENNRILCNECFKIYNIWLKTTSCTECNKGFGEFGYCLLCECGRKVRAILDCCYKEEI